MLILFTAYFALGVRGGTYLVAAAVAVGLSVLPDVDVELMLRHRGVTHSLLAAFMVGLVVGAASASTPLGVQGGFAAGFTGVVLHILGDALTYTPLRPLWPLSKQGVALRLFRSNDRVVNHLFMALGVAAAALYLISGYLKAPWA